MKARDRLMGNSGHNWAFATSRNHTMRQAISRSYLALESAPNYRRENAVGSLRRSPGTYFPFAKASEGARKMRGGGGRSDEDAAGNCNGWNGTLAESKTNRVVFHDRKDRSERGIHEARDRREVEGGRKRRALTIWWTADADSVYRTSIVMREREKGQEGKACIHLTPTWRVAFRNDTTLE